MVKLNCWNGCPHNINNWCEFKESPVTKCDKKRFENHGVLMCDSEANELIF